MQKRILCFGDSNTWGYIPTGGRYDEHTRWPMHMAELLGSGYAVVEEGFNGRTCVQDDPVEGGFKSGVSYLPPCLMSHNPLDVVIIMLGINDTKRRFGLTPMTIGQSMMSLVRTVKIYGANAEGDPPHIIITAPTPILPNLMETRHGECFGEQAIEVSRGLTAELLRVSKLMRVDYFDASPYAEVSVLDAVHMTARGHIRLAEAMAEKIRTII